MSQYYQQQQQQHCEKEQHMTASNLNEWVFGGDGRLDDELLLATDHTGTLPTWSGSPRYSQPPLHPQYEEYGTVVPPRQVSTYDNLTMVLPAPLQQSQAEPYCYGNESLDNSRGVPQYANVEPAWSGPSLYIPQPQHEGHGYPFAVAPPPPVSTYDNLPMALPVPLQQCQTAYYHSNGTVENAWGVPQYGNVDGPLHSTDTLPAWSGPSLYIPQPQHEGHGYPAVVPPPQVSTYDSLTMVLPVPWQQPQAGPSCYGSESVDHSQANNAWGVQQYSNVDRFTPHYESVNTRYVQGHLAPLAVRGTADEGYRMSPTQEGLTETEPPHPTYHPLTNYPHPHDPSYTLAPDNGTIYQQPPTYSQDYGGGSIQVSQESPANSDYNTSPDVAPPPQPPTPPYSDTPFSAPTGAPEWTPDVPVGATSTTTFQLRFEDERPKKVCSALPEDPFQRPENGSVRVLHEWKAVKKRLDTDGVDGVSLEGNFYIKTWDLFEHFRGKFLCCHEENCWSRDDEFLHRAGSLRTHLGLHGKRRVALESGETKVSPSYVKRVDAAVKAWEAKAKEPFYAHMIKEYKRLAAVVRAEGKDRLLNAT